MDATKITGHLVTGASDLSATKVVGYLVIDTTQVVDPGETPVIARTTTWSARIVRRRG